MNTKTKTKRPLKSKLEIGQKSQAKRSTIVKVDGLLENFRLKVLGSLN